MISARRPVSRVACICTSGLPTPPTTWTTVSATWVRLGRITSTAASSVALHEETPMTSPPIERGVEIGGGAATRAR